MEQKKTGSLRGTDAGRKSDRSMRGSVGTVGAGVSQRAPVQRPFKSRATPGARRSRFGMGHALMRGRQSAHTGPSAFAGPPPIKMGRSSAIQLSERRERAFTVRDYRLHRAVRRAILPMPYKVFCLNGPCRGAIRVGGFRFDTPCRRLLAFRDARTGHATFVTRRRQLFRNACDAGGGALPSGGFSPAAGGRRGESTCLNF